MGGGDGSAGVRNKYCAMEDPFALRCQKKSKGAAILASRRTK
jgi:hypothetical protein